VNASMIFLFVGEFFGGQLMVLDLYLCLLSLALKSPNDFPHLNQLLMVFHKLLALSGH
jgi:hypothetical protein